MSMTWGASQGCRRTKGSRGLTFSKSPNRSCPRQAEPDVGSQVLHWVGIFHWVHPIEPRARLMGGQPWRAIQLHHMLPTSHGGHFNLAPLNIFIFETRVMMPSLWDCHGDSECMKPSPVFATRKFSTMKVATTPPTEAAFLKVGINGHNAKLVSCVQQRLEIVSESYIGFFFNGGLLRNINMLM